MINQRLTKSALPSSCLILIVASNSKTSHRNEGKKKAQSYHQWEQATCFRSRGVVFKMLSLQFILINSQNVN